jgi:hypothetical protein
LFGAAGRDIRLREPAGQKTGEHRECESAARSPAA